MIVSERYGPIGLYRYRYIYVVWFQSRASSTHVTRKAVMGILSKEKRTENANNVMYTYKSRKVSGGRKIPQKSEEAVEVKECKRWHLKICIVPHRQHWASRPTLCL